MDNNTRQKLLAQLRAVAQQQLSDRHQDRDKAVQKMQALGANDDADTVAILLDYLLQTENELLPPLAASRLSEIGGELVIREVIHLLNDSENDTITILMLQILADIGHETATLAIEPILKSDRTVDVRARAAFALGKTGGKTAFDTLMHHLHTETHAKIRQQIVAALGWLKDDRCVPDLVQIMQTDPDKETQTFAAEALGRLGSSACFEPLVETLKNHEHLPIVRYYAAYALGILGDERAIVTLQAIIDDPHEHSWVAQMASESLQNF